MTYLGYIVVSALGALIASFIGVVSERVYTGQSWKKGRSKCNSCSLTLTHRDLVPVFSWLSSSGKCRRCGSRLPASYVIAEILLAVLFALSYHVLGLTLALLVFLVMLSILGFVVLYDLRHTLVPPMASLLLVSLAFIFALLQSPDSRSFGLTLIVAGCVSLFLFLIHALSKGRAMGLGDVPVVFALALVVGAPLAFAGLLFSFWIGAVVGIVILLVRRGGPTMGIEVPFVPFMAAGFLLAFFTQWNPFPLFVF